MELINWSSVWQMLKDSFVTFGEKKIFTKAAALAYYTIFSLPPILAVISFIAVDIFGTDRVEKEIFEQMGELIGTIGAGQIMDSMNKVQILDPSLLSLMLGIIILIFTSTTIFITIQIELNEIFDVEPRPKRAWVKLLRDRAMGFAMVISISFTLLVFLVIDTLIQLFLDAISVYLEEIALILVVTFSFILTLGVISFLFYLIFKILPDAKVSNREAIFGGVISALLFMFGKYLISFFIGQSNAADLYEAAGAVLVLLLWVFYSSVIFLLGAVLTKEFAVTFGDGIEPVDYAVKVKQVTVEKEKGKDAE